MTKIPNEVLIKVKKEQNIIEANIKEIERRLNDIIERRKYIDKDLIKKLKRLNNKFNKIF
jgi:flagellar capping protein FliD